MPLYGQRVTVSVGSSSAETSSRGQVPARRQVRLEQRHRLCALGQHLAVERDPDVARGRDDVDPVVGVARVDEHLLVLLEPLIHPVPVERDQVPDRLGAGERLRVVPGAGLDDLVADPDRVVGRLALLGAPRVPVGGLEHVRADVLGREVVGRLVAGLGQQQRAPAVGDRLAADHRPGPT